MKKVFSIGLVSLFLIGCDKTVTKEMLVGDWKCEAIEYKSTWDGNNFGEFRIDEKSESLVTFKYKNNSFYVRKQDGRGWHEANDFLDEFTNETKTFEGDDYIAKSTKTLRKINDNKFLVIEEYENIQKYDKDSSSNKKDKTEVTCNRIK